MAGERGARREPVGSGREEWRGEQRGEGGGYPELCTDTS